MATNLAFKTQPETKPARPTLLGLKNAIRAAVKPLYVGGDDQPYDAYQEAAGKVIADLPLTSVIALYHHVSEELAARPELDFDFEGTALQVGMMACIWRIITARNLAPAEIVVRAQIILDTLIPNHEGLDLPDAWIGVAHKSIIADLRRRQF